MQPAKKTQNGAQKACNAAEYGEPIQSVDQINADRVDGEFADADPCTKRPQSPSFFDGATACGQALHLRQREDIHQDDELRSIQSRALAYLVAGAPVHLRGPAGMGKTTLALQVAQRIGRPVVLVTGDSAMTSADLLGREVGMDVRALTDRYVHSVRKSESTARTVWSDNALTAAVEQGHTLVYDEFTRAPAEANNALLSALEERLLVISNPARGRRYIPAHPEFRVILTSNPDEYVGVSAAPDALFDRLITFDLTWNTVETETGIVASRSGLAMENAAKIVAIVRSLRAQSKSPTPPSMRAAITIGRIVRAHSVTIAAENEQFVQICLDVLETRAPRSEDFGARSEYLSDLRKEILRACTVDSKLKSVSTANKQTGQKLARGNFGDGDATNQVDAA